MHSIFRFPPLMGLLLLASVPLAGAETPLPDPIAPAVVGRPLEETWAAPPARKKPAQTPKRPKQVLASKKAAPVPAAATAAVAPAAVQQRPAAQQLATQTLGARAANPPGFATFFSSRDQELVRRYYDATPASAGDPKWKIGERVPERSALTGVPRDVRTALPVLPPGYQYVQLDGEVVLVAVQSRVVVDGVSRGVR